ncbi:hypothetical protein GCM10027176_46540 [Actinoallomurus bryophytorum]|uniref:WXG100 family type VII secretion target n=1 Tax=Actinoallomurus bryophytorum TaxID=1490222 RepID=A0A543CUX4_9ACTN|nr:hypothetical protein [Actinoallomurus bryophytorum]TQM00912.1 hypothetical protein FB559_6639 [Actinoallomurus bryophytorum]
MPIDYDAAILYVDPDGIKARADDLETLAKDVVDSLEHIETTLSALQLGWAGKTADEAKDFGDRWELVMKELFGSNDHPETGVLNAIVNGLLTTRGDFAKAEDALVQFFQQFGDHLAAGGDSSTPTSAPPSITDLNLTAITETW